MARKKKSSLTVVIPCYNEESNLPDLYEQLVAVAKTLPGINFKFLFADNKSNDSTRDVIRELAKKDKRVQGIFNLRNYGYIRSTHYALTQTGTDAAVLMAADLQDPPHLLEKFIEAWQNGYKVVAGVKSTSRESKFMYFIRDIYYRIIGKIAETKQIAHFTGFGLYDREVIHYLRETEDQKIYLRGFVAELGYEIKTIEYEQPIRERGKSRLSLAVLFDFAMVGMTSNSKIPIRMATYLGLFISFCSFVISIATLAVKIYNWEKYELGIAPVLIGVFFFGGVQLIFTGLIGEYIAAIHSQLFKRPLVIESERVNL